MGKLLDLNNKEKIVISNDEEVYGFYTESKSVKFIVSEKTD